jgi:hypothetical protein
MLKKKKLVKEDIMVIDILEAMGTLAEYGSRFSMIIRAISTLNLKEMEQTFEFISKNKDKIQTFLKQKMGFNSKVIGKFGSKEINAVFCIIELFKEVQIIIQNYED